VTALRIDGIQVIYRGSQHAVVDGLSLQLKRGEVGCLLGPSGCGKTTVLRAIAGFERLRAGSIVVGERVLSSQEVHLLPEQRAVGLMFQEIALFPHLDAASNIGFGLRRAPRQDRDERVAGLLALVGLEGLGQRFPHELSGGQQQRVALARALAPAPALMLLDEPFSNLDSETRLRLAAEVREILTGAAQTTLLVTHDEIEAHAMGDWIGTMREGRIVQWRHVRENPK
jgi:iron(III) transport system ATP-binding protein